MVRCFMTVLAVLVLVAQPAAAQDEKGPFSAEFSMGSGPVVQPGNLKDYFNSGFSLQAGFKADAGDIVSFRLGLRYLPLKLNSDRVVEEREPLDPLFTSLAYNGGTRHSLISGLDMLVFFNGPRHPLRPYLFAGGGYAIIMKKDIVIREVLASGTSFEHPLDFTKNEYDPAVSAGFGLDGGWENTRYFFEAEYIILFSEELESGWPEDYVEHMLFSPHGPTQLLFIHGGLRFSL